jgi:steroid delta-isomerase-like uncharacterized protein
MSVSPNVFADVDQARQNADVIVRFFAEVLARRAPEAAKRFLAANYRDEDPAPGDTDDAAGVVDKLTALWTAFPDGTFELLDVVAAQDRVFARSTFTGTQTGAFGAMPASGRAVSIGFFDLYVVVDGRITGHRHLFDQAKMMQQLSG